MADTEAADLAALYRQTRERLTDLVSGLGTATLASGVPACPGWAVRDVVAHLSATAQDAVSGRLTGVPTDEYTADQVSRLADVQVAELLARWAEAAPRFEEVIGSLRIWPAVIDVASHEQDIRGAIGRPGARDTEAIRLSTAQALSRLRVAVPLRVVTQDCEFVTRPPDAGDADPGDVTELTLRTTRFEAFRWRLGRRSRAQLAAMTWSADPSAVLDHLTIFGPAASDIVE